MSPPLIYKGTAQLRDLIPLAPKQGSTVETAKYAIRLVGPLELQAGDRVLVTAREQLDNENRQAGGGWKEWMLRKATLHKEGTVKRSGKTITAVPWYWLDVQGENVPIDPRWSLWVGNNLGVVRTTSPSATTGTDVIRSTGENWDNWIHHWRYFDAGWDVVVENVPAAYYVTVCWFETTPEYLLPGQMIEVTNRGSLEAAVYR